jgi:hypothetical protein
MRSSECESLARQGEKLARKFSFDVPIEDFTAKQGLKVHTLGAPGLRAEHRLRRLPSAG